MKNTNLSMIIINFILMVKHIGMHSFVLQKLHVVKMLCLFTISFGFGYNALSQGMLVSGSAGTADPSAMLEVQSTSLGMLVPRMTTTQRNAIASPATGLVIYNTTTNKFNYSYNGTWIDIVSSSDVIPVTNGGTGLSTTTAYGVITGGTTANGAFQNAGTGTSGQVLTSQGTTALPSWVTLGATFAGIKVITSGSTYTAPADVKSAMFILVGGGGAGGGVPDCGANDKSGAIGGGGGAGGYIQFYSSLIGGTSYSISIGSGGVGVNTNAGGNGGSTSITIGSNTFTAGGGSGGQPSPNVLATSIGTGGSGGTVAFSGSNIISGVGSSGQAGFIGRDGTFGISGEGGSSIFGPGAPSSENNITTNASLNGNAATVFGAGGSGALNVQGATAAAQTSKAGGNGFQGCIVVYEYK